MMDFARPRYRQRHYRRWWRKPMPMGLALGLYSLAVFVIGLAPGWGR